MFGFAKRLAVAGIRHSAPELDDAGVRAALLERLDPADTDAVARARVIGPALNGWASVTFPRYQGWYQALDRIAENIGDDQHAVFAVRCENVGYLGEYRRSPVTRRWFSGSHAIHLLGA